MHLCVSTSTATSCFCTVHECRVANLMSGGAAMQIQEYFADLIYGTVEASVRSVRAFVKEYMSAALEQARASITSYAERFTNAMLVALTTSEMGEKVRHIALYKPQHLCCPLVSLLFVEACVKRIPGLPCVLWVFSLELCAHDTVAYSSKVQNPQVWSGSLFAGPLGCPGARAGPQGPAGCPAGPDICPAGASAGQ